MAVICSCAQEISARLGGPAQTFALEELNDGLFYHAAKTKLGDFQRGVALRKIGNPRDESSTVHKCSGLVALVQGGWGTSGNAGSERERRERYANGTHGNYGTYGTSAAPEAAPIYKAAPSRDAITIHISPFGALNACSGQASHFPRPIRGASGFTPGPK